MEAKALFGYKPKPGFPDELGFRKGDTIKILCENAEPGWHKAELRGEIGFVPSNFIQFVLPLWYMSVTKEEAVQILTQLKRSEAHQPDGAFIVRPSQRHPGQLSLSVKTEYGTVEHFNIIRSDNDRNYFLWKDVKEFSSINSLVSYYRTHNISDIYRYKLVKIKLSKGEAAYDFRADPDNNEELSMSRGDKVVILSRAKAPWWLVQMKTKVDDRGQSLRGMVPASYVKEECR